MIQQIVRGSVFVVALVLSPFAYADEDHWSLSGFATLGAVRSNTNLGTFAIPGQLSGATQSFDFGVDSKIGIQGTYKLNSQLSVTAQLISKKNDQNNWNPKTEWFFGKIQAQPNLAFRFGRIGLPLFLVSDFRDVNFANPWTRPPLDVYAQAPLSHFDGGDVLWDFPIGNTILSTQFLMGRSQSSFQGLTNKAKSLVGMNATIDFNNGLKLRLGKVKSNFSIVNNDITVLTEVLPQLGFDDLAQQLKIENRHATFSGLGLSYDEGRWIALAEYTTRRTDSFVSDTTGWYATVGHRFGAVTPYVTFGKRIVDDSNLVNSIPVTPFPPLEALRLGIDEIIDCQNISQRTLAVGFRWDIYSNTSLKMQLERVRAKSLLCPSAAGQFIHVKPGFQGATLLGISLDVLF